MKFKEKKMDLKPEKEVCENINERFSEIDKWVEDCINSKMWKNLELNYRNE